MDNNLPSPAEHHAVPSYISLKKAAELVDVGPKTIRNWIAAGQIQGYKLGQMWRVDRGEVLQLAKPVAPSHQGGAV
ncbi:helix-turn-helix domain-containing protein [Nocardia sp. A7]|uniref:helix-turn-helix domain-containing protein n=1 Tax=Nocardia sp. A7 TaxID=2789274 RepID=UPI0039799303